MQRGIAFCFSLIVPSLALAQYQQPAPVQPAPQQFVPQPVQAAPAQVAPAPAPQQFAPAPAPAPAPVQQYAPPPQAAPAPAQYAAPPPQAAPVQQYAAPPPQAAPAPAQYAAPPPQAAPPPAQYAAPPPQAAPVQQVAPAAPPAQYAAPPPQAAPVQQVAPAPAAAPPAAAAPQYVVPLAAPVLVAPPAAPAPVPQYAPPAAAAPQAAPPAAAPAPAFVAPGAPAQQLAPPAALPPGAVPVRQAPAAAPEAKDVQAAGGTDDDLRVKLPPVGPYRELFLHEMLVVPPHSTDVYTSRGARQLSAVEFYRMMGRPDLAAEADSRKTTRGWLYTMSFLTFAGGIASGIIVTNNAQSLQDPRCYARGVPGYNDCVDRAAQTSLIGAALIGAGVLVGGLFATWAALTPDMVTNPDETSRMAAKYNRELAQKFSGPSVSITPMFGSGGGGLAANVRF